MTDKFGCYHCLKQAHKHLLCSRCRAVWYCDRTCQKADWNNHKLNCQTIPKSSIDMQQRNPSLDFISQYPQQFQLGMCILHESNMENTIMKCDAVTGSISMITSDKLLSPHQKIYKLRKKGMVPMLVTCIDGIDFFSMFSFPNFDK